MLKLLSFVSGQRLLTPEQAASQLLELENLRDKQIALESLTTKLRGEIKREQALAREQLINIQKAQQELIALQQSEIDSLKEALGQLNQSVDIETQRQLKENNDLLTQLNWLSGTIAHDFRAPLRAIDAYSFFLADDLGDNAPAEASKSLEEIRRNGKRMGLLLDALIEYLRLGICPLNIQLHDLNETLVQVVNEHFDFSPVPIEIQVQGKWRFDRPMMMRAFKELIDNAVKFSKPVESPKIIIRQNNPSNLEIIDNGVGFSDSHDAQKFQLFHRMHGNDEFEGEGIGLATAERIASRHHISLSLNRVGAQTVASLRLPQY
ncbi:MAG: ATP-binding protein [Burkholderiales bacterium]|uniref:sensor histidine kinase n=1 Tax=Limnobacter sp. TaxID=2003368 RepID=UPI0039BD6D2C|nr:ATP-binding protein [Burkholderiales bacterium]